MRGGKRFFNRGTGDPGQAEPRDFCMPAGFPASVLSGNAMQLFQTKNYLVWVHEFQRNTRIIPLDGRPHREGLEPMYDGDPVGKWEGDTLVIDTTNFKRWAPDDHHTRMARSSACTATRCTPSSACAGRVPPRS